MSLISNPTKKKLKIARSESKNEEKKKKHQSVGICTIFWNINALLEAFGIGIFMEYSLTTTSLRANARNVPAVLLTRHVQKH